MIARVDALLHIASVADLIGYFAENAPEHLGEDGQTVVGFDRTPTTFAGDAGLVYIRLPQDRVADWSAVPGVTILAQVPYAGAGTPDSLYSALFADLAMVALYDAVYDRTPYQMDDGQGGILTVTPPERIGQMG